MMDAMELSLMLATTAARTANEKVDEVISIVKDLHEVATILNNRIEELERQVDILMQRFKEELK